MKVFYRNDMSVDSGGFSPSARKPEQAIADWQERGLDIELVEFDAATSDDLCLAHDARYVKAVLSGKASNGHGNRIPEVTQSCLKTVGSLVAASRAAFAERIVCSPTSGFHHAGYGHGHGFCTFNGLIVAARTVINEGLCDKVAILDCDAHYGDGTADCIYKLDLQEQIEHWTYGIQFGLGEPFSQKKLLAKIRKFLKASAKAGCGLVLFQAGADPFVGDSLGGDMTKGELRERDALVFNLCIDLGLPVAYCHAGGYARDEDGTIEPVLSIHRATAEEAIAALSKAAVNS